ncbi:phage/plasmid primase, P4 family [Methylobacterium sp. 4-46]|uniref:phage/plasmid primase, P4 family n=1 Tax=unclassified Methylobacterium TaxID=2615210 RepID=UPI000165C890|nr:MULTISPECIES: phage/plasmid primase, P4 family [Methylobacterium]ACA15692.1 phage/plasmid primase, P4 family [Methylobacterium sp. 4-46]WFT81403.1 phage/plasmid primase, P4 family [Methylobacterium nodulans]
MSGSESRIISLAEKQAKLREAATSSDEDLITEDGVALEFAKQFEGFLRYNVDSKTWLHWTGTIWETDKVKRAFQYARELARRVAQEAPGHLRVTHSKVAFAANVETFAKTDPRLVTVYEDWDLDPYLLGTPGGTIDLRTGELRPALQSDMITRTTAVAPADTAECPQFLQFLDETFGGDTETVRFLQQWCGYCLTGDTTEQRFVFGEGKGGNGKGVLIGTALGILKDYATVVAMEALTAAKHDRHPTEIAALRGKRLVTASETEGGREWAEARIKALTGGDRIKARFMRQDEFEFLPQFKLFVMGNNRPSLRNVDQAMRRRLIVVPFNNDVPKEKRDPDLPKKLEAEWPGILRWMIDGCLDWQANRLISPKAVEDNTEEYFSGQDLLGQFLAEKCDLDPGNDRLTVGSTELYNAWKSYALVNGEEAEAQKVFSPKIAGRGFPQIRGATGRGFSGIRLKPCPDFPLNA